MRNTHIHPSLSGPARTFRGAVSLHSHTLHSRESFAFLPRGAVAAHKAWTGFRRSRKRSSPGTAHEPDLSRAWWTPPLSPRQAWNLEVSQIENALQLRPHVSLTDHDSIEAGILLRVSQPDLEAPISVEWTVPYRSTFFHLGVHHLPPQHARTIFGELALYSARPAARRLASLLTWLQEFPQVLVVLNHPCWDEKRIGYGIHLTVVEDLLRRHGACIHALELNGFRPPAENRAAARLAAAFDMPLVSGGDRHGREPSSVLNLTNAKDFSEFVDEVRRGRRSEILLMPQQREPRRLRLIRSIADVLRDDDGHALGWKRWSDRIFYWCDDGESRSLRQLWGDSPPELVSGFVGLIRLVEHRRMQDVLRLALAEEKELAI